MVTQPISSIPRLSAESTRALGDALSKHALENGEVALEQALGGLCTEAHVRHLPPEAIVHAMKDAWTSVRRPSGVPDEIWSRAYYSALGKCLTVYFDGKS